MKEELSEKNNLYNLAQYTISKLTAELDASNARFKDVEFNFKKFEVSSEKVEVMIENHLQFRDQSTEGLGYNRVPPPFNNNYTPPIEPIILKKLVIPGQSTVPIFTQTEKTVSIKIEKSNESNASTSCADSVLVEDWVEEDENDSTSVENTSNTNILSLAVSNNCVRSNLIIC